MSIHVLTNGTRSRPSLALLRRRGKLPLLDAHLDGRAQRPVYVPHRDHVPFLAAAAAAAPQPLLGGPLPLRRAQQLARVVHGRALRPVRPPRVRVGRPRAPVRQHVVARLPRERLRRGRQAQPLQGELEQGPHAGEAAGGDRQARLDDRPDRDLHRRVCSGFGSARSAEIRGGEGGRKARWGCG